jgi:hypothetical protein
MNKPGVFSFNFYDRPSGNIVKRHGFIFSPNVIKTTDTDISLYDDYSWFQEAMDELESEYGVHDWGTAPTDDVIGVGYFSYEVKAELIPELMEKWREVFVKQSSENDVSEVVTLEEKDFPLNGSENDTFEYNLIKSKLKQSVNW